MTHIKMNCLVFIQSGGSRAILKDVAKLKQIIIFAHYYRHCTVLS